MKRTVMEAMKTTVDKCGDRVALKVKKDGEWQEISWQEYYDNVLITARAFMALGLEKGKAISIIGNNCPQWFISDLAGIFAGAVPGGIYTTNSPEQCHYIAEHSEANIAIVENDEQLAKFKEIRNDLPNLKAIVLMNGSDSDDMVYSWEDIPKLAEKVPQEELEKRMAAQDPDDCCTLIYTSGTTGKPKGVMLSHDNLTWTARQVAETIKGKQDERIISYLPLSHIAEQIVSLHGPIIMGAATWFAESLDKLADNLTEVRPTLFLGVPRVWEKIQAKMLAVGANNPWILQKIAGWAKNKGRIAGYAFQEGKPNPPLFNLANKLVYSKVRDKLGLDQCRLFVSSAAPISMDTLEYFMSLNIPITEVYGMSECTGPATVSLPEPFKYRTGWAGPVMPGTELSIAEDGEVLMRGRHIFKGYFKNEEATKQDLDADGWLHSGDVGKIDETGFLKITDRKKELIITAGGENIPPQVLEGKLKAIPILNQVVVIGDKRKYITALFTLDPERVEAEAKSVGSTAKTTAEAAKCEKFNAYMRQQVDKINSTLARVQTIKKFIILPKEFSVEGGELTPTMKMKRRIINDKYAKEIESMY